MTDQPPVPVFRLINQQGPIAGIDNCIASVPSALYRQTEDGQRALDVELLRRMLSVTADEMAARVGRRLHHSDWIITANPAVVEEMGMHGRHDCVRCRASVDQALAALSSGDHEELLVGVLYWMADP